MVLLGKLKVRLFDGSFVGTSRNTENVVKVSLAVG
jgi:hypothetical protein